MKHQAHDWSLFEWFNEHNPKLGMTLIQPHFFKKEMPNYSHFRAKFKEGKVTHEGFASSQSFLTAFNTACVETLERWLVVRSGQNSNGFALHPVREEAALRARLEIVERDSFFCHYLLGMPFCELDKKTLRTPDIDLTRLSRSLRNIGLEFKFYRASARAEAYSVLAVVFGENCKRPFGLRIGMAASHQNQGKAAQSALLESLRGAEYLGLSKKLSPSSRPISLKKFKTLKQTGPTQHSQLGADLDYAKRFFSIYLSQEQNLRLPRLSKKKPIALSSIAVRFHRLKHPILASCPIFSASASKAGFQDLFFGETSPRVLNSRRLKEFADALGLSYRGISSAALELPHPFP